VIRLLGRLTNLDGSGLTHEVFMWSKAVAANNCKNWFYTVRKFLQNHDLLYILDSDKIDTKRVLSDCKEKFNNVDKAK
jgi:hypothetical protein